MRLLRIWTAVASALIVYSAQAQHNSNNNLNQEPKMKDFSLLVRVPVTYTTEQAKEVGPLWDKLLAKWKQEKMYVISFAFPGPSQVVVGAEKIVGTGPVLSNNLRVVSTIVLRLSTIEDAITQARECPILPYGGSVEVREIPAGVDLPVQEN